MRNIRQNLFFAFIYNSIGVPIAAGVLYPAFGILLSPDDRGAGDVPQLGIRDRKCAPLARRTSIAHCDSHIPFRRPLLQPHLA